MFDDPMVIYPLASATADGHTKPTAGSAKPFNRILQEPGAATYISADGFTQLKISHTSSGRGAGKRGRHLIRYDMYGGIEGPAAPGSVTPSIVRGDIVASAYVVVDCPAGWEKTPPVGQLLTLLAGTFMDLNADGDISPIDVTSSTITMDPGLLDFLGGEY